MKRWLFVMVLPISVLFGACGDIVEESDSTIESVQQELTPCLSECYGACAGSANVTQCRADCRDNCNSCEQQCQPYCYNYPTSPECDACMNECPI